MVEQTADTYRNQFLNKLLQLLIIHSSIISLVVIIVHKFDAVAGYSALFGGLVFLIPNVYFTACTFRYSGKLADRMVLQNFYKGETGKFLLSCLGFAVVFVLVKPVNVAALFATYICLTLVQCFVIFKLRF